MIALVMVISVCSLAFAGYLRAGCSRRYGYAEMQESRQPSEGPSVPPPAEPYYLVIGILVAAGVHFCPSHSRCRLIRGTGVARPPLTGGRGGGGRGGKKKGGVRTPIHGSTRSRPVRRLSARASRLRLHVVSIRANTAHASASHHLTAPCRIRASAAGRIVTVRGRMILLGVWAVRVLRSFGSSRQDSPPHRRLRIRGESGLRSSAQLGGGIYTRPPTSAPTWSEGRGGYPDDPPQSRGDRRPGGRQRRRLRRSRRGPVRIDRAENLGAMILGAACDRRPQGRHPLRRRHPRRHALPAVARPSA